MFRTTTVIPTKVYNEMTQQVILQVSELTRKVKFLLENELNTVWLCGEISNFIAASSGHWYLSLKDKKSQIVDQKRIKFILKNIKKKSIRNNIDPKITQKIWKNMIYAYIDFERRNFKKKKLFTVRR